jgi:glutathione S-transferase
MAFDLSLEFIVSGKPARVMQLLTDAALIRKWSGEDAVFENRTGGRIEMFDGWVKGEVLKTGEKELSYTWKAQNWGDDVKATEVHYFLTADEGGTKVLVKHTGFPDQNEMDAHKSGWTDFVFDPMEDFMLIIDKS